MTKDDIEQLARDLSLPDFDLLLIADGSGMTAKQPYGWACLQYSRGSEPFWMYGAGSHGSNNKAELEPFVHALMMYTTEGTEGLGYPLPSKNQVVCVTDSELTARCGSGQYARRANLVLWNAIDFFQKQFEPKFIWRHVPRNSNQANAAADHLSRKMRTNLTENMPAP